MENVRSTINVLKKRTKYNSLIGDHSFNKTPYTNSVPLLFPRSTWSYQSLRGMVDSSHWRMYSQRVRCRWVLILCSSWQLVIVFSPTHEYMNLLRSSWTDRLATVIHGQYLQAQTQRIHVLEPNRGQWRIRTSYDAIWDVWLFSAPPPVVLVERWLAFSEWHLEEGESKYHTVKNRSEQVVKRVIE